MNTDIKQAMHVEAGKSFGTAEANENERHWNDDKIDRKNQDPTNHYDKTRMKLNFEIGPDGKVHPLGYQEKSLEVRLKERLTELGWKPFKPDSKIQPNCCAKFIFGGDHDRTLEMAFGTQTVNLDKGQGMDKFLIMLTASISSKLMITIKIITANILSNAYAFLTRVI